MNYKDIPDRILIKPNPNPEKRKLDPCPKCKNKKDFDILNCGYSSFNVGHVKCLKCGYEVNSGLVGIFDNECIPELINLWNRKVRAFKKKKSKEDELLSEKRKSRQLRKQLRDNNINPVI